MLREIRSSLGLFISLMILTGVGYPFIMTLMGQSLFYHQANGSLIKDGEIIVGSELIGQNFLSNRYFHSRPSFAENGYNATASSGSNYAPSSKKLIDATTSRVDDFRKTGDVRPIPVDLVTASGSGLDPDISIAAAHFQAPRIAIARNLSLQQVEKLISLNTTLRTFSIFGENRVNVLVLNRALDLLSPASDTPPASL